MKIIGGYQLSFSDILNSAVIVSVSARGNTERTQINQLLEKLESEDGSKGVIVAIIHILRQIDRGKIGREAAKEMIKKLKEFLDEDENKAKNHAREYLGLIKWLYDGNKVVNLNPSRLKEENNFKILIEDFLKK